MNEDLQYRVSRYEETERENVLSVCRPLRARGIWRGARAYAESWMPGLYSTDRVPANRTVWTFDDGPMGSRTERLLDLLAEGGVRAVFFVVGTSIDATDYSLVRRIVADGHVLANHSFNHDGYMVAERERGVTRDYIVWQYTLTQAVVDAALLATDADDFQRLFDALLGAQGRRPSARSAAADVPALRVRHAAMLRDRANGVSPYPMRWARPPGGAPWFGRWDAASYVAYAEACAELGLINAYWHHQTDDSNPNLTPEERSDPDRISAQIVQASRAGGVLLAHDRVSSSGVRRALRTLAEQGDVEFITLDALLVDKYGCAAEDLGVVVQGASGWWARD